MKPMIIYAASIFGALVFEWGYWLYSRKSGAPLSKSQWCSFFWASVFLLCGISLMLPYDLRTLVDWSPMFLLAFFHIQQSHQREIVNRMTGIKQGKSGSVT